MQIQIIKDKIIELRGFKLILDHDLAILYEVETKNLKRAVNRNLERFPDDFMFQLTSEEWESLRCQFGTLKVGRGQHIKYLPYAFTEQGVAMLSSVLGSKKAIEVNIFIIRAFVYLRNLVASNQELSQKLKELESKYDKRFKDIHEALNYLLTKDKDSISIKSRTKIVYKN